MSNVFDVQLDTSGLSLWSKRSTAAVKRSAQMAGRDALRSMRAEANRQIRAAKAMKLAGVSDLLVAGLPSGGALVWTLTAKARASRVIDFRGVRQTGKGVSVEINVGGRIVIAHAFIATMKSGHRGVFMRYGQASRRPVKGYKGHARYAGGRRQPIRELYTTRVVDAFKDALPAVGAKGQSVFMATFKRVLPLEVAKRSA